MILLISTLLTWAAAVDAAPSYPVSNFPTQNPFESKLVNAGWVNQLPLVFPFEGVVSLFSNMTLIV